MTYCIYCEELIRPDDVLFTDAGGSPFHHDCFLRLAIGSIGHQQRKCPCFGGSVVDPPQLSRREAARLAADYFRKHPHNPHTQA